MDETLNQMVVGFDLTRSTVLDWAVVLAALGTVAMALLELIKVLTFARYLYHWWSLRRWLGTGTEPDEILEEVILLTTGRSDDTAALYNQPDERFFNSIEVASLAATDWPTMFPKFYGFLTRWTCTGAPEGEAAGDRLDPDEMMRRINGLVARRVAAFRLSTEFRWARLNQAAAFVCSAGLVYFFLSEGGNSSDTRELLLVSLGAATVAPFAKDIANALMGIQLRR